MFVLQHLFVASIRPVVPVHSRVPNELMPGSPELARRCRSRAVLSSLGVAAGHDRGLHRAMVFRIQMHQRPVLVRSTTVLQLVPR